jgi:hypothetical protein
MQGIFNFKSEFNGPAVELPGFQAGPMVWLETP